MYYASISFSNCNGCPDAQIILVKYVFANTTDSLVSLVNETIANHITLFSNKESWSVEWFDESGPIPPLNNPLTTQAPIA